MQVGDKVRIKRTNTIHEIESIIIGRYWNRYKLKGVCYSFLGGELEFDLDKKEPIKKVSISEILRVGDKMRIKGNKQIYEIESIYKDDYFELLGKDGIFHISELEIVIPNKPVRYEPKLKYVSIDNFKVGDIVEKDGFLFEILEIKLSKFKLKTLSKDFYIEANCKELNKCRILKERELIKETDFYFDGGVIKPTECAGYNVYSFDVGNYFRVEKKTNEPEFDFIATWQKEREFYLIESKGGSLSRMDKPEFEEYCEKMDRLNVKYRIIE